MSCYNNNTTNGSANTSANNLTLTNYDEEVDENDEPNVADMIMDNDDISSVNENETTLANTIAEELVDKQKKSRTIGVGTDTQDISICEPGTNILLEGIVWNETSKGVLLLNVSWRGKTFVGSLIDTSKASWAPPRFKDMPKLKTSFYSDSYCNYSSNFSSYSSNGTSTSDMNNLSADPTVRTLRNGKRRYINQFENDLMSDLEYDLNKANAANSTTSTTSTATTSANTATNEPNNTPSSSQSNGASSSLATACVTNGKPKGESTSSASSVNEEEFDTMTQSSTTSTTSSKSTKFLIVVFVLFFSFIAVEIGVFEHHFASLHHRIKTKYEKKRAKNEQK